PQYATATFIVVNSSLRPCLDSNGSPGAEAVRSHTARKGPALCRLAHPDRQPGPFSIRCAGNVDIVNFGCPRSGREGQWSLRLWAGPISACDDGDIMNFG